MSEQKTESRVLEQQPDPFARRPHGRAFYVAIAVVVAVLAFGTGFAFRGKAHTESVTAAHATTQGKQLWTCGMHPQVIQDHPGDCPICHMELTPLKADTVSSSATAERKVKYWWDPMMNPPYIADKPGRSPMGMDLVPVYEDEVSAGTGVTIDPVIVQNMGVRIAPVVFGSVQQDVRVVGYLEEPEPLHRDVNLRVKGWIEKLHADTDGMPITKGQPLFELYSPEIQVAVEELIAARRAKEAATDDQAKRTADTLFQSTARKLELWGLEKPQVAELAKLDRAPQSVTFLAPIGGHLTEKKVYEGAAVEAGMLVMRLADRHRMWVDAQVYEQQLPLVKIGSKARATIVSEPGKVFEGEVVFIHPHLDPTTRTARVRIQIPNEDYHLRQGMYATVDILTEPTSPAPVVPREAVIDTGKRQIAFVAQGGGRFEPRLIKLGTSGRDGLVQILSGLAPNEQVVTSGQFLLDSESRLKEAIQKHLSGNLASKAPPSVEHVHAAMPSPASIPTTTPAPPLDVPHTDEIAVAYLQIVEALGATQQSDASIGVDALVAAAGMSAQHAQGEGKPLAESVAKAAEAMKGKPIADQRKALMALSDAVIALLDRSAPSTKVSNELYVAYCPMAFSDKGASWVQKVKLIANPYYATEMKSCGEVKRAIAAK
jgi:Cu(I)/Ag(I) efflux system membrane fusion protein/cobalt-zinc-cadmium efflux system membrane fusion protein